MKAIKRSLALMLAFVLSVCVFANTGFVAQAETTSDAADKPALEITSLTTDLASPQYVGTTITIKSEVINMSAYRYNSVDYYVIKDGVSTKLNATFEGGSDEPWTPTESGQYTLRCQAVDVACGETVTKDIDFTILDKKPALEITSLTTDLASPQYVGTTITIKSEVINMSAYRYNSVDYYVIKDGVSTKLNATFEGGSDEPWTPTESGQYTLRCQAVDVACGENATKDIEFTILDKAAVYFDNSATKWSAVYAYVWNNTSDATVFAGTKIANNIYSFDIKGNYKNILFKNTAGTNSWNLQTKDLVMPTTAANCYKPSSSANKASGSWYAYQVVTTPTPAPVTPSPVPVTPSPAPVTPTPTPAINPVISADKNTVKVGDTITFTCSASYENGSYKNGRMLYITDPSGETETITGWDANPSYSTFEKIGEFKYTHTYVPTKVGTYTFQYGVNEFERRVEKSAPITVKVNSNTSNTATVYYSTSWSNANIHYRVGNGAWTVVPGKAMTKTSEVAGYNFKYVIDLGTETEATVCFNNGSGSWDSRNGANYAIPAGVYGVKNQGTYQLTVSPTATPTVKPTATPTVKPTATPTVKPTATPTVAPTTTPTVAPTKEPLVVTMKADKATKIKVGETVNFVGTVSGFAGYYTYSTFGYKVIDKATNTEILRGRAIEAGDWDYDFSWTPDKEGKYTITFFAMEYSARTAETSMDFEVVSNTSNTTTVYYSTSWTKAYIHYKVNGVWTSVPGKQMTATTDVAGYNYKFDIDLGSTTETVVCFNNGNGSWDSKNGSNYTLGVGTYGIKNQVATSINLGFAAKVWVDKAVGGVNGLTYVSVETTNGTSPYTYEYTCTKNGAVYESYTSKGDSFRHGWTTYTAGTYDITIKVTDALGKTATDTLKNYVVEDMGWGAFTASVASPQKVGTAITLNAEFKNAMYSRYNTYSFYATKDGVKTPIAQSLEAGTCVWTPSEAGTYTLSAEFFYYTGETYTTTMTYTVKDNTTNTVKVYYNNNSWSNAYIHYQVNNGAWTSVPGVKMSASDNSAYKWMYTIDLGTQTGATLCFNNGSGSWDSKNGSNYKVGTGSYAIANGNIVTISK